MRGREVIAMPEQPVTHRIAADLRQQIADGDLPPGALMPSETELATAYGVSRQTAVAALRTLEHEGLVMVRPRRGRIVRSSRRLQWRLSEFENPARTVLATSDAWETDIESQGHDPSPAELTVETTAPPPSVAARLGLSAGDSVVVRRHLRGIDGTPAVIADDYFDARIVAGTELQSPEDTSREDILAEAGYEQTYAIDEIVTRMPTPDESAKLGIARGIPVAELTRTSFTANDQPVRVMIAVIPGNIIVLQYSIPT
jgi:DNA-binding GntR family transcriptional regulator